MSTIEIESRGIDSPHPFLGNDPLAFKSSFGQQPVKMSYLLTGDQPFCTLCVCSMLVSASFHVCEQFSGHNGR